VLALLEGRQGEVLEMLRQRMVLAASEQRYEEAAALRDQLRAIEKTVEQQKAVRYGIIDQDVVGIFRQGGEVEIVMLFYRQGKLTARRNYNLNWQLDEDELLAEFLSQFYGRDVPVPDEVVLPFEVEGADALSEWLTERRSRKVHIVTPQRGERRLLVELANRNAEEAWRERGSREEARRRVLEEVRQRLNLQRTPERMECFDISTIQGHATVASMAVVVNGESATEEYRHYRVKSVVGTDDYAALREVLQRRLKRGVEEGCLPDFILIDGGKGQLGVLSLVLDELDLTGSIDVAGIAKSRVKANVRGRAVERSEERFFLPGRKNPVTLRRGSAALFLLERLRDEAHRFAITHHRKVRGKSQLQSVLAEVQGVGPKRQKALLKHFGSLKKIKSASLDELQAMPGLPSVTAAEIHRFFNS
jgi:excinuclease ABC subunit C